MAPHGALLLADKNEALLSIVSSPCRAVHLTRALRSPPAMSPLHRRAPVERLAPPSHPCVTDLSNLPLGSIYCAASLSTLLSVSPYLSSTFPLRLLHFSLIATSCNLVRFPLLVLLVLLLRRQLPLRPPTQY